MPAATRFEVLRVLPNALDRSRIEELLTGSVAVLVLVLVPRLRRSEVLGLRRQDVDFERQQFTPAGDALGEDGALAILRRSRISMIMDVYTHVVGDDEREAAAMLADLLEDPLIG
ncbi:hypothetical protein [Streptomyces sp. NPDC002133]|uniref:hypothetical protein n=1 Tax=Streptomyces sp. NPDC002133 TaxID=3154409 RepID=UPI0033285961